MTLQYREQHSKDSPLSEWYNESVDSDGNSRGLVFTVPRYRLEIREKPSFVPGYFRLKLHTSSDVRFHWKDPNDLDDLYERVEVTPVDTDA